MKLKLIKVPYDHINPLDTPGMRSVPLGVATLTGFLRQHSIPVDQDDFHVRVLDEGNRIDMTVFSDETLVTAFTDNGHEERLESEAEKILQLITLKGYDVIGLSYPEAQRTSTAASAMVLAKLIKERYNPTIILGGLVPWTIEKRVLQLGAVDFIIEGDARSAVAEVNVLNFCDAFERGKDLTSVGGLKYFDGDRVVFNERKYTQSERYRISTPSFKGLPLELYKVPREIPIQGRTHRFSALVLPYFFMRGCPHSCAFCCFSNEKYWNAKDPETVAAEVKELSRRHHTSVFLFLNTQVNPTREYAEWIADAFIRHDVAVKWADCATPSCLDPALLKKLKEAGAVKLSLGFETGSERMSRSIRKPLPVPKMGDILRAAYDAGIWAHVHLICGFPHERKEDVRATVDFLESHQRHIMSCHVNMFFLDGQYLAAPDKWGVKLRLDNDALHQGPATMGFDEVGGLKWEEIVTQTEQSHRLIKGVIDRLFGCAPHLEETVKYLEFMGLGDVKRVVRGEESGSP